jgi:hypothetical protein
MPTRKTDATKDDAAAPETAGGGEENRAQGLGEETPAADQLPVAGAESEPSPRTEPAEVVDAVTVDETHAEPAAIAEPVAEPVPEHVAEELAEPRPAVEPESHEEHVEEEPGRSLAARVLTGLVILLAGAALGIWGAPKLAPLLPSGMQPVANWLTPGVVGAETEVA